MTIVISKVMPACVRNPLAPLLSSERWSVSPDLSPCPCIHDTQTAVVAGLCGDGTAVMYLMVLAEASSRRERRAPLVPVLPVGHCEERWEAERGLVSDRHPWRQSLRGPGGSWKAGGVEPE